MASFITFLQIFFLFFAPASSAPIGHGPHEACEDVRMNAHKLNSIAKEAVERNRLRGIKPVTPPPLAWMEAEDKCDPGTLRHTPEQCIKKMLHVLKGYKSFVKKVAKFDCCPVARNVANVLQYLHANMSICMGSRPEDLHHNHNHHKVNDFKINEEWQEEALCEYTTERLFSFSILTARVFSVGDPANHAEPTDPTCGQRNLHV